MDMTNWFTNTVSTKRLVTTLDSGRKPISTFSENLSSVKCSIEDFKSDESVNGGRKFSEIKYSLFCRHGEDIIMSDLVTYKSVDYEIVSQMFEEIEESYQELLLAKSER